MTRLLSKIFFIFISSTLSKCTISKSIFTLLLPKIEMSLNKLNFKKSLSSFIVEIKQLGPKIKTFV